MFLNTVGVTVPGPGLPSQYEAWLKALLVTQACKGSPLDTQEGTYSFNRAPGVCMCACFPAGTNCLSLRASLLFKST